MNTKIILAEDEAFVRQTTAFVLRLEKVEVLAETDSGEEAMQLCRKHPTAILVADLRLNGLDALSVLLRLRAENRKTPAMIYTGCMDDTRLAAVLDAKPKAMVHKTDTLEDFRNALRFVAEGISYFSPMVAKANARLRDAEGKRLTETETEVLTLIAKGYSNKRVAEFMRISDSTAGKHREHLMVKLDVHETASLTRLAVKMGLVDAEP